MSATGMCLHGRAHGALLPKTTLEKARNIFSAAARLRGNNAVVRCASVDSRRRHSCQPLVRRPIARDSQPPALVRRAISR